MTVHLLPSGMPSHCPHYAWKGPVPKLRGERLDRELSCFCTIADRIKGPTFYGAYLCSGEIKTWRSDPSKRPKRVPLSEIADGGTLIVAAHNVDDHGNSWPL